MINSADKKVNPLIITAYVFLVMFVVSIIDKDILFLLKETQETVGIMKNIELETNEIIVEYEINNTEYISKIRNVDFEKGKEINLLCNVNDHNEIIAKERKTNFILLFVAIVICLFVINSLNRNYKAKYFYNNKRAKVIEGEIFEVLNQEECKVCLRVKDSDKIYYLMSDINLEPILEKLNIKKLPIYIKGNYYIVDTRLIEEHVEIIKEKIIFS